jgi:PAS domain S-box-containing protein
MLEGGVVHVPDILADPDYATPAAAEAGIRTQLGVPFLRNGEPVGTITLNRRRVEPFTERQIELVRTFADQAVIAMENARLLTETREALEQQTATSDVLQVINASPGDLAAVFDAMLVKATAQCEAAFGILLTWDGECFHRVAWHGVSPELREALGEVNRPAPGSLSHRIVQGENLISVEDMRADESHIAGAPVRALARVGGTRSFVAVALRKDGALLGQLSIYRQEVRPFTDKQIALLQNFAAQAVIAMENARLLTETHEALERQTATAEVLGVINASPGNLTPVFEAMLERATRLCEATSGLMWTTVGERFQAVATRGMSTEFVEFIRDPDNQPRMVASDLPIGRVVRGEALVHVVDLKAEAVTNETPAMRKLAVLGGFRTVLALSLRNDAGLLGAFVIGRREVRPFTDKQIALLQNFAAQAVIAMENARLITETREALDQQTATAEVLQVINTSPGNLTPVFDAMLEKAMRLCEAAFGGLWTFERDQFTLAASRGVPAPCAAFFAANTMLPGPGTAPFRFLREGEHSAIEERDLVDSAAYRTGDPARCALVDLGGARSALQVPLVKDDAALGVITVYRQQVRPFTEKQVALLENFAAQAVIAMENARLITETREALDQQTATAQVLGVINSSPGDLTPVFDAMLEKAMRLCDATFGTLWTWDGQFMHAAAVRGASTAYTAFLLQGPHPPSPIAHHPLLHGATVVHLEDLAATEGYRSGSSLARAVVELGGVRTLLAVPLRKDATLLGVFSIYRDEVRAFTDKQIALLQSFAAQAVIAIENARLLDEIRHRQAELRVTFDNMGDGVVMFDAERRLAAWNRNFQQLLDLPDALLAGRPSYAEYLRLLAERGEFGADDVEAELARRLRDTDQELRLERERPDGRVIEVRRNSVPDGGFVLIYSDITERKRSEEEIRAARDTAEAAYHDLQAAQANLVQAQKMAALGQLTAGIAHEIKNPLNFVNNFASLSTELLGELKEEVGPALAPLDANQREEIDETIELLTGNLEKIVEHGQRADNIVKSMLEHSRGVSGERREVDLNGLVDEALSLAYHGARAHDHNFNITLERDYAASLKPIELAPQEMTRVFLNLFGNGFYAANKRAHANGDGSFHPILTVATREDDDAVEVRVRDNGTGIPPEIKDKLFQPFFTTKPTGEGTGLGLSISYDIVTQQHGGTIEVASEEGAYTEFTIRLPRNHYPTGPNA